MIEPFMLYVRLYAEASGQDYTSFRKRFNTLHVKNFNIRISSWMTNNRWTKHDISGLIWFCYQHNPLNMLSLTEYGNMDNIGKCVGMYARWLYTHEEKVAEDGLLKAISVSAPNKTPELLEQAMTLEQVYEVYGRN
jgi:hypothetical protein